MSAENLQNVLGTPVKDSLRNIWKGIIILLLAITAMWMINIWVSPIVNFPIALVGTILIAMTGFKSAMLVNFGIFGAFISLLQDKDKSQGAATGLIWLTSLVIAIGYAFILGAFILLTWSFESSPGAFWIIFLGATLLLLMQQVYDIKTSWAPKVIGSYVVVMMTVAMWTTFGGAYSGQSFNPKTGEALYMMDTTTGSIDTEGRSPEDCRPLGRSHVSKTGVIFDYANKGTCFSAGTGKRLIPLTTNAATLRSPAAWPKIVTDEVVGTVGEWLGFDECENSTETHCFAKMLGEEEDAAKKLAAIARQQRVYGQAALQPTHALVEDCRGEFAKLKGCELVIFRGDPYPRTGKPNMCIDHYPNTISRKHLSNGDWEYTARKGSRIYLFDLNIGEKYLGNKCV